MKRYYFTIQKNITKTRKILRSYGYKVNWNDEITFEADSPHPFIIELAKKGCLKEEKKIQHTPQYDTLSIPLRDKLLARFKKNDLSQAECRIGIHWQYLYQHLPAKIPYLLVRAIGKIGEQTQNDIERYFKIEMEDTSSRKYWNITAHNLHSIQMMADYSAGILTIRDFRGAGRKNGRDTFFRGVSFRSYLIVRDSSSGEAHILRVPPKYGNEKTKFYQSFATPADRIQSAIAWTFGLSGEQYQPQVEA